MKTIITGLFLLIFTLPASAGIIEVITDTSWKTTDAFNSGFETFGFDDSSWRSAHDVYNVDSPVTDARIIWDHPNPAIINPGDSSLPNEAWFRHEFEISGGVSSALLDYLVNDELDIYINEALVVNDRSGGANSETGIDISSYLQTGNNLIAVYGKIGVKNWQKLGSG